MMIAMYHANKVVIKCIYSTTLRRYFREFCGGKIFEVENERHSAKLYILDFLKTLVNGCENYNKYSVYPGCCTCSTW